MITFDQTIHSTKTCIFQELYSMINFSYKKFSHAIIHAHSFANHTNLIISKWHARTLHRNELVFPTIAFSHKWPRGSYGNRAKVCITVTPCVLVALITCHETGSICLIVGIREILFSVNLQPSGIDTDKNAVLWLRGARTVTVR